MMELYETIKQPDHRLRSPFTPNFYALKGKVPTIAGITDTHLQTGQRSALGIDGISSGKGNVLGLGNIKILRDAYRRISQMNLIALHTMRAPVEEALGDANLLIHGGDVTDAMTLNGVVSDLAYQENYLSRRLVKSRIEKSKDPGFKGTVVPTGNHDTDFEGPDKTARYTDIAKRYPQIPINVFKLVLKEIEAGEGFEYIKKALADANSANFALHPGLKWYLQKAYFGQSIGAFIDKEAKQQVFFLDSELNSKSGSPEALERSLVNDISLDQQDPKLFSEIVEKRKEEQRIQGDLIHIILLTCDVRKTVVYAHNPVQMQDDLIEAYRVSHSVTLENARKYIETNIVIWGGHWHTNDDGSAKNWNRPGVKWWNGVSRIGALGVAAMPGKFPFSMATPYTEDDYVSVLQGSSIDPQITKVSAEAINEERERLMNLAR